MKNLIIILLSGITLLFSNELCSQVGHDSNTDNSGLNATALGSATTATGNNSVALGVNTTSSGRQSLTSGQSNTASGTNSAAIGQRATASGEVSFAIGDQVQATNDNSVVIGSGISGGHLINDNENSLMVGFNSTATTLFVGTSSGGSSTGMVGIGNSDPNATLDVRSSDVNPNIKLSGVGNRSIELGLADENNVFNTFASSGDGVIKVSGSSDLILNSNSSMIFATNTQKIMTLKNQGAGKVGIGTESFPTDLGGSDLSNYQLFVAGGILTEEVRVRTDWADYVFYDDYELKTLSEVEEFISINGHLPNVPSAEQVENEGIEMGEIIKIQQEKIEELTLYLIELQKQVQALNSKIN